MFQVLRDSQEKTAQNFLVDTLERSSFLYATQAVSQTVHDDADGVLARQLFVTPVLLVEECLSHRFSRHSRVLKRRLELGIVAIYCSVSVFMVPSVRLLSCQQTRRLRSVIDYTDSRYANCQELPNCVTKTRIWTRTPLFLQYQLTCWSCSRLLPH
jgi:hypothetical protein